MICIFKVIIQKLENINIIINGEVMNFIILVLLEILLFFIACISLIYGYKGYILPFLILSIINYVQNQTQTWFWQTIIIFIFVIGCLVDYILSKKANSLILLKKSFGGIVSFSFLSIFFPIFFLLFIWTAVIGLPILLSIKNFKINWLLLCLGWRSIIAVFLLICGNLLI